MNRILAGVLAVVLSCATARSAVAAPASGRLDPRLVAALAPGAAPVAVWVEFVDRGEQGPGDLVARLAAAERALTPECRARRLRTGVRPLVDERDLPVAPAYLAALEAAGLHPYGVSRWFNGAAVRASGAALARLAALDCVRLVSPAPQGAPRVRAERPSAEFVAPVAPLAASRASAPARTSGVAYGLTANELARLAVPALHDSGYTGAGVLVCMCDDGFDYYTTHDATRGINVGDRTRDFVAGGTSVQDTVNAPYFYDHGEWTLSVIGGNAPGVFVGPAFGARFALARTEDESSEKPVEMVNWLMAAEWADSLGADLISSSVGYFLFPDSAGTDLTYAMLDGHTSIITRAVEIAAAKGILVVSSAGNGGGNGLRTLDAPADACGDSMLAVGALDSLGLRASYSSQGPTADGRTKPDVMAQGSDVIMASASGQPHAYVRNNGTSFSCPLVAGIAACLIQARPAWTIPQLVHALKYTAANAVSPDDEYGWGLVDAWGALQWEFPAAATARIVLAGASPMRLDGSAVEFRFGFADGTMASDGTVDVYDTAGRRVRSLWNGWFNPGEWHHARWDGTDASGRRVPSGIYFVSFEHAGSRSTARIVALR